MLSFVWPWMFALLPLPILVRWLMPPNAPSTSAIRVPFYAQLVALSGEQAAKPTSNLWRALVCSLIWILLISAVARPVWIGEPVPIPREGRDLMLAVDISRSMENDDMQVGNQYVSRIRAVKAVVGDFVERRVGDRVGLILFGEQGFLQTPLTFDRAIVSAQLNDAQLGFAGNATAIGDAIGLAVKRLRDRPAESRVLVLLTDGANTAGTDPREAASIAAEANIRIHTIGVGADSKNVAGFFGRTRTINPSADLDEDTLQFIAQTTGGQYFRARDPSELIEIYSTLDSLEPLPEDQLYRPQTSMFHWLLGAALGWTLLALLVHLLAPARTHLRGESRG